MSQGRDEDEVGESMSEFSKPIVVDANDGDENENENENENWSGNESENKNGNGVLESKSDNIDPSENEQPCPESIGNQTATSVLDMASVDTHTNAAAGIETAIKGESGAGSKNPLPFETKDGKAQEDSNKKRSVKFVDEGITRPKISVVVTGTFQRRNENSSGKHTVYRVQFYSHIDKRTWSCDKRYNDFLKLDQALNKHYFFYKPKVEKLLKLKKYLSSADGDDVMHHQEGDELTSPALKRGISDADFSANKYEGSHTTGLQLCHKCGEEVHDMLLPLPVKKWFTTMSETTISVRKEQLKGFLQSLLNCVKLQDCNELTSFIAPPVLLLSDCGWCINREKGQPKCQICGIYTPAAELSDGSAQDLDEVRHIRYKKACGASIECTTLYNASAKFWVIMGADGQPQYAQRLSTVTADSDPRQPPRAGWHHTEYGKAPGPMVSLLGENLMWSTLRAAISALPEWAAPPKQARVVEGGEKAGYLKKRGHLRKNLKRRYFVLQSNNILRYYKFAGGELRGTLNIAGCRVNRVHDLQFEGQFVFEVEGTIVGGLFGSESHSKDVYGGSARKVLQLHAATEAEMVSWMKSIQISSLLGAGVKVKEVSAADRAVLRRESTDTFMVVGDRSGSMAGSLSSAGGVERRK